MKKHIREEKWWDKRDFVTAMSVAVLMALGFLQGYFAPSFWSILFHFCGALIAYVIMRWIAIRREKKDLAEIEALEKEWNEKMRQLYMLQQRAHMFMGMHKDNEQPPQ